MHHAPVRLTAPLAQLMPYLTGENDRAALERAVGGDAPKAAVAEALAFAARSGLLEP